jgi:GTP-binding protein
MVPIDADDIMGQYKILLNELKKFNPDLLLKDRMLAITKADTVDEETRTMLEKDIKKKMPKKQPIEYVFISSATGYGIDKLKDMLWSRLNVNREMER